MTVDEIKRAIAELPGQERQSIAAWLNQLDYDDWDREMAIDFSTGGRGYHLVEKVKREIAEGKARPIKEDLAEHPGSQT